MCIGSYVSFPGKEHRDTIYFLGDGKIGFIEIRKAVHKQEFWSSPLTWVSLHNPDLM